MDYWMKRDLFLAGCAVFCAALIIGLLSVFFTLPPMPSQIVLPFMQSVPLSPPAFLIFAIGVPAAAASAVFHEFLWRGSEKRRLVLDTLGWRKRYLRMEADPYFAAVPGEKTAAPMATCFIRVAGPGVRHEYARDVIVTDRRVLIGSLPDVFVFQKETFGQVNLWRAGTASVPKNESPFGDLMMKGARIGEEAEGGERSEYVEVELEGMVPLTYSIYHPESRNVCGLLAGQVR